MYKHLVATVSPFTQMSAFPMIGRAGRSPERGAQVTVELPWLAGLDVLQSLGPAQVTLE